MVEISGQQHCAGGLQLEFQRLMTRCMAGRHEDAHAAIALLQRFGVIFAEKECATIFPFRTTNVSVPASYMLSAVSAFQRM